MTEIPKSLISKPLSQPDHISEINTKLINRFLEDGDMMDYLDFIETLDCILGKNRLDIFSSKTFDRNAKEQRNNKDWVPVLWFLAIGLILFSVYFSNTFSSGLGYLIAGIVGIIGGGTCITYAKLLKEKASADDYNKLMENAGDPQIARIVIDWTHKLLESDTPLFQNLGNNKSEIPPKYRKAKNMVMVLLGDDRHRQALGINKRIPETPFLYKTSDFEHIFRPLVKTLSRTVQYAHFSEYLKPEQETSIKEAEVQAQPIKTITEKPKKQSASEPSISQAREHVPRDDQYTLKVWNDSRLLERLASTTKIPEFIDKEMKGNGVRQKWARTFSFMNDNRGAWELYLKSPSSTDNDEFVKELFGKDYLNTKDAQKRREFRIGSNQYLNNFIKIILEYSV